MNTPINRSSQYAEHVPVLIVGGGLAGLSASLFLSHYGISSLLVERHPGTSKHPKQFGLSARAMELLRSVGLEEAVQAAGAEIAQNRDFVIVSTLAQGELQRYPLGGLSEEEFRPISPTSLGICPQDALEPLLLEAARKAGSELRFGTELHSFEETDDGILATLLDRTTGKQSIVHADYMIAADGAGSRLRQKLGIEMQGHWSVEQNIGIYFHADLGQITNPFILCLVTHPEANGVLLPVNNRDRWIFLRTSMTEQANERLEDFTPERCVSLLRLATGMPELEIELKNVLAWDAAARVASRFSQGRVFLVGDAAHQMPPTGGFGASTGVQDAQNLAWKLAMVLHKQATPALLTTYDSERRPVAQFTTEQARLRWQSGTQRHSAGAEQREELGLANDTVVMLAYQYDSQAIIAPRQILPSLEHATLDLNGDPGTRAPHLWIEHQGKRISTLDLYGKNFVLLTGEEVGGWQEAARAIARRSEFDLTHYIVGSDFRAIDEDWYRAYGITPQGAVLVRPDGFVAWKSSTSDEEANDTLQQVFSRLLRRQPLS